MLDSDDNFVEYGTPLEPLEEDEVPTKKPILVSDQIVVDENGRRRFHGAFTGGFSAGYYNTVGSKEGWTPSTFKSSREGRDTAGPSRKAQNVQDYMDEEDLGAFGIAPQILRNTNDFDQRESRKRARPAPASSGPIPGVPVLEQIIMPVRETVGMRILQRMGWRPGKGVGPSMTKGDKKKAKKKKDVLKDITAVVIEEPMVEQTEGDDTKVYGCFLPPELRKKAGDSSDSGESTDVDFEEFVFAPDDLDNPLCNPKENTFGLGYSGLDRNALSFGPVDLFGGELKFRVENKKLNIRGEAFGIGAFEDADEEVYSRDDLTQYDFALETPGERQARKSKTRHDKNKKAAEKTEAGVLAGFVRAKKPHPEKKYFRPPHLPKNFEPRHAVRKSRFETEEKNDQNQEVLNRNKQKQGLDRHALTVEERQVLLGEANERVGLSREEQEAKEKEELEESRKEQAIEKSERLKKFAEVLKAFSSSKSSEGESLGRPAFKPFMKNPEKQDRYDKYTALVNAGYKDSLKDIQPMEMTEWEREREKMEFERASALYKPISGVMSSRFVSAQSHDISHLVPLKETVKEKDPTQDPKIAAKMNLFGKLTHRAHEWHPDRLLSKRFNVPHPHPDSKMVGVRRVVPEAGGPTPNQAQPTQPPPSVRKSLFDNIDFSKPPPGLFPVGSTAAQSISNTNEEDLLPPGTESEDQTSTKIKEDSSVNTCLPTSDESPPLPSKPPIDLFKEIFENSSSESEPEEEPLPSKRAQGKGPGRPDLMKRDDKDNNVGRQDKVEPSRSAKGIFDNLDFSRMQQQGSDSDSQNPRRQTSHIKDMGKGAFVPEEKSITELSGARDREEEEDIYGPRPGPLVHAHPSVGKNSSTAVMPIPSSKEAGLNPISLPQTSTKRGSRDEGEVEWVEKAGISRDSSSKSRESNKAHHHKKKKSKDKAHRKSKKPKKHHKSSSKKSKKAKSRRRAESGSSEDESSGSSSSEDDNDLSAIRIHQSVSNKALLSKLKEITQFK